MKRLYTLMLAITILLFGCSSNQDSKTEINTNTEDTLGVKPYPQEFTGTSRRSAAPPRWAA